jgi:CRISPR/Cas system-associated protein Cas10 (large subunit of type III CRISPR-Cas system)
MYAFFDGDNIGDKIEIMLLENRVTEATEFSEKIKTAMSRLHEITKTQSGVEVIIFGGDDLLLKYESNFIHIDFLEKLRSEFLEITGNTMSCGIGESVKESVMNLYFAKLYGKNQIKLPDIQGEKL